MTVEDDEDLLWVCFECIQDAALRTLTSRVSEIHSCSFCKASERQSVPLPKLAELVDGPLRMAWQQGNEEPRVSRDSDSVDYVQRGDPLEWLLQEELGIEHEPAEALAELLCKNDPADISDGDEPFYDRSQQYHRAPVSPESYATKWAEFEHRLSHVRRFFDSEAIARLSEFLGSPQGASKPDLPTRAAGPTEGLGQVFRARLAQNDAEAHKFFLNPAVELGPPPTNTCRAGRMSSAGIPVFYSALSEETAIAEVRPPVGSLVLVATFDVLRNVRLLDLTKLGREAAGSIFAQNYAERAALLAFLRGFHELIARPVLPGEESIGYLATQAISEYAMEVLGYDGILYASSQNGSAASGEFDDSFYHLEPKPSQCNIVLHGRHADPASEIVRYREGSVCAVRITATQITYHDLYWTPRPSGSTVDL